GVHSVRCQVQYDLLQLNLVGAHRQRALEAVRDQTHASLRRLGQQEMQGSRDRVVEVELLKFGLSLRLQQLAQVLDDLRGVLIGLADVAENRLDLDEVRRIRRQQKLRGFGAAQDRAERLVDVVRDGRRQRAGRRGPVQVNDLEHAAARFKLGAFAAVT